jgi:hypothetical protein
VPHFHSQLDEFTHQLDEFNHCNEQIKEVLLDEYAHHILIRTFCKHFWLFWVYMLWFVISAIQHDMRDGHAFGESTDCRLYVVPLRSVHLFTICYTCNLILYVSPHHLLSTSHLIAGYVPLCNGTTVSLNMLEEFSPSPHRSTK